MRGTIDASASSLCWYASFDASLSVVHHMILLLQAWLAMLSASSYRRHHETRACATVVDIHITFVVFSSSSASTWSAPNVADGRRRLQTTPPGFSLAADCLRSPGSGQTLVQTLSINLKQSLCCKVKLLRTCSKGDKGGALQNDGECQKVSASASTVF
jgi:hypothetical protein